MKLTSYEQEIFDGNHGKLKQTALSNIIDYARILGAEELCEITKATVYCGAHSYLDVVNIKNPQETFSKINLGVDEVIPFDETDSDCFTQSCVCVCDMNCHEEFNVTKEKYQLNLDYLKMASEAGVIIANTCTPYLNGWIPAMGEHFVTTESGVTTIGNSLFGARCNADGIEAAFWSSICGRTPKWGMHVEENRGGTHLFVVDTPVETKQEFDILGAVIGKNLPYGGVPVVVGNLKRINFDKLRQMMTSVAITSNCELCHIVGYTPEALTQEIAFKGNESKGTITITDKMMKDLYMDICDETENEVDFVSIGCPHLDINNIKEIAEYLKDKKICEKVHLGLWTSYPIKHMAEVNGYLETIESAGGYIFTDSCPPTIGPEYIGKYHGMVFDSYKMCKNLRNKSKADIYFGDVKACLNAAISGKWEADHRWKK